MAGFEGFSIEYGRDNITTVLPNGGFKGLSLETGALRTFLLPQSGFGGLAIERNLATNVVVIRKRKRQ